MTSIFEQSKLIPAAEECVSGIVEMLREGFEEGLTAHELHSCMRLAVLREVNKHIDEATNYSMLLRKIDEPSLNRLVEEKDEEQEEVEEEEERDPNDVY
jgi:CO dehydrogenase/acetyl-CoA synthase beta subunit